jgi:inner membrane protein
MDSLTQIVLGAACGAAVAGKKMGNRAMLWGAIGGTIPDLDVFASFFSDEITSTSFHRGIMHSFLFAALAPWVLAWLAKKFYGENIHQRRHYKAAAMATWLIFYIIAAAGINFIPIMLGEGWSVYILLPTVLLGARFAWRLWLDYWQRDQSAVAVSYRTWVALFFWSIFTHPILDCFTSWGTQIFQPFSDLRVQWCTVSVVDPMATVPFLILLFVASRFKPENRLRSIYNWLGLAWFCGYLLCYTTWHKALAIDIFNQSFHAKNIEYERLYTNPTIFNNIAWTGISEGDTAYYYGLYSFNDPEPIVGRISTIPKNHQLLSHIPPDDRALHFLRWFSDGYYNVIPYHGDTLQVNDLRFGLMGDTLVGNNYIFPFLLFRNKHGVWDLKVNNRNQRNLEENKRSFAQLWKRITGSP